MYSPFKIKLMGAAIFGGGLILLMFAPVPPIILLATSLPILFHSSTILLLKVDQLEIEDNPGIFQQLTQRYLLYGLSFYLIAVISLALRGNNIADLTLILLSAAITMPFVFVSTNLCLTFPHKFGKIHNYTSGKVKSISKYGTLLLLGSVFAAFFLSFLPFTLYEFVISSKLLGEYYQSLILSSALLLVLTTPAVNIALPIYRKPEDYSMPSEISYPDPPRKLEILIFITFTIIMFLSICLPILADIQGWS